MLKNPRGCPRPCRPQHPFSGSVSWHVRELQYRYWTSRRHKQAFTKPNMSRRRKTGSVALFSMVGTPNPASTSHTQLQLHPRTQSARIREPPAAMAIYFGQHTFDTSYSNFPTRPFQSLGHLNERIRVLETPGGGPVTVI